MNVRLWGKRVTGAAQYLVAILLLSIAAPEAHAALTQSSDQALKNQQDAWRERLMQGLRNEPGCFEARYPSTTLQPAPCASMQPSRTEKAPAPFRPRDENSSGNQTAISSGSITTAIGTFDQIANVTQAAGFGNKNNFTIQLNTNGFSSPICKASHNRGCVGAEQFVVDSGGSMNIQTWLVGYLDNVTTTCPDSTWSVSGPSCWKRAVASKNDLPVHIFNQLQGITLTATAAANGQDSFLMTVNGFARQINVPANLNFGLAGRWKLVDFNVYGESNNEVIFNPGAVLSVLVGVKDGAANPPTCGRQGLGGVNTVETSNLTLERCVSFPALGSIPHGVTFYEGVPVTVKSVSPAFGSPAGGAPVTVTIASTSTGANLSKNAAFKFGKTYASRILSCNGTNACTVVSPPGSGAVDVTVVNLSQVGGEGIFSAPNAPADNFQYRPVPPK